MAISALNGDRWYAIHTKPHQEYTVQGLLRQRGIRTYLPCLPRSARSHGRPPRDPPFFGCYLFAQVDWTTVPFSSINWAPGVNSVVHFGGVPAEVDERILRWLHERLARMNGQDYFQGRPLRPGDRLRITQGALRDTEAIFDQRLSAGDRARVFIEILGRLTACQVELRSLQRS